MGNETHFYPYQTEHKRLSNIKSGGEHIRVDLSKIPDMVGDDSAEDIAQEMYDAEIATKGRYTAYVDINPPALDGDIWVIRKTLNELGDQMLQALQAGALWNRATTTVDWDATIAYYRAMMAKGSIEMRFIDLLLDIKSDELRDLRNELVYFKMRGIRKGDIIYGPDAD